MLVFDEQKLKQMLMEECNYPEKKAEYVIGRIKTFDEQLQPILDQWMKDKSISDHAVNGVTFEMVYKHLTKDFFEAMACLSAFAKRPEGAKVFLKFPEIFRARM